MRVMFTVFPAPAHFLPVVSYAWALQSAGNEVCVATAPGPSTGIAIPSFHKAVTAAGLTAVSCGDPQPLAIHDGCYPELIPTIEESDRFAKALGLTPPELDAWDCFYHFVLATIRDYHPPEPRQDIAAIIEFARQWKPDLVIWDPWFPCGAVAARAVGAAHARALNSPDYPGWFLAKAAERSGQLPEVVENLLADAMRPLAERYGVTVDDDLLLGQWTIDPFPASMRISSVPSVVPTRYVPYTGAGLFPDWLQEPPGRRRVALSLGVSAREFHKADWGRTARLLDAVADLDVEVVATLNSNQLLDVPDGVPGNVRTFDYVPLSHLLPTCSAIIHHGAPGTFAAASAANVPQLICDTDERPRSIGAVKDGKIEFQMLCEKSITVRPILDYVTGHNAGVRINHQTQSADKIRSQLLQVLDDPAFQEGAKRIHDEWSAMPNPASIVPQLVELTAQHR
jgi:UDP:flavonoid glycosyltransferase YjiC (YdhE family)